MSAKTILVVDDNIAILDSLSMLLQLEGYKVNTKDCASNIDELPEFYSADLLVLDVFLSGEDGRNICRKLKTDSRTKTKPILMMSAGKDIENSVLESGADDFIAKPFHIDGILDKVKKLLN